jgi:cytidine diphosphoramidate kinase
LVTWIIGLSGSGKTTLGKELWQIWRSDSPKVVFLDGDLLRDVWGDDLGHDVKARYKNARRISHLCRLLDQQEVNVVACVLSMFPEWQAWNRREFSSYYEIFLDLPLRMLEERDPKGIYKKFREGEVTDVVGLDIKFPKPQNPDLVVGSIDQKCGPQELATKIYSRMGERN